MGTLHNPPPAAAGIDAPAGIQFVPAAGGLATGDTQLCVTMFKDITGTPDRIIAVGITSTNTVSVIEYKLLDNVWVFDPADCARDTSVTLSVTAGNQIRITAFAIDDPVSTGDRVLFIATTDAAQTPDTFEINSIVLTPGASSLTAVLCVIAGANAPNDTDNMETVHIPLSDTRVMTFFEDDAHFADITESTGIYTFTYTDAKVLAVDTSINVTFTYSGIRIGDQVVLAKTGISQAANGIWEMSVAAVLTEEFLPFTVGGIGTHQEASVNHPAALVAIGGKFGMASPYGGGDAVADESAYVLTTFPLDDI